MAKRFTATEKWRDGWFSSLTMEQKMFWLYLLDECDNAGLWEKNFKVASFFIGVPDVSEEWALKFLSEKIVPVSDNKWFVPKFVEFQYGELRPNNRPHITVVQKIKKYGLEQYVKIGYETPVNNNIRDNKREKVFQRDNYTCVYCNQKVSDEELQTDHITPLSRGGDNSLSNVATSCKTCNLIKQDLSVEEYIQRYGLDRERILTKINAIRGIKAPTVGAKEQEQEQAKDKDKEKAQEQVKAMAHESTFVPAPQLAEARFDPRIKEIQDKWNAFAKKHGLPEANTMHPTRLTNIVLRLREPYFDFDKILTGLEKRGWGLGKNGYKIEFDKIIGDGSYYIGLIEANTLQTETETKAQVLYDNCKWCGMKIKRTQTTSHYYVCTKNPNLKPLAASG